MKRTGAEALRNVEQVAPVHSIPWSHNRVKVIDHEEYPRWDIGGNRFVRTVVGLRDNRDTRQRRIRYVQVDGQDPARLVLAIRLRLHARRPARHLFAGRNLSQYRKLPARGTVEASTPERALVSFCNRATRLRPISAPGTVIPSKYGKGRCARSVPRGPKNGAPCACRFARAPNRSRPRSESR